jgi:hypothetical protein
MPLHNLDPSQMTDEELLLLQQQGGLGNYLEADPSPQRKQLGETGGSTSQLEQYIKDYAAQDTPIDWTPLTSYIDYTMPGSNLTAVAQSRKGLTKQEKAKELVGLQDTLVARQNAQAKALQDQAANEAMIQSRLSGQELQKQKEERMAQGQQQELGLMGRRLERQEQRDQDLLRLSEERLKQGELGKNLTPGQRSADITFAKDYQDWSAQGGYAGVQKQLGSLDEAVMKLQQNPDLTGPTISILPDAVRKRLYPESIAVQQQVEQAVQQTLRQTLGSQFTEKEGQQIMQRTYDPALPAAENIKKIQATIKELDTRAMEKDKTAQYFEQFGTISGYQPTIKRSDPKKEVLETKEWNGRKFEKRDNTWVEVE